MEKVMPHASLNVSIICTAVALAAPASGLAADEMAKEERQVSGFTEVVLHAVGDLIITQGPKEALVIEAEKKLLPKISAEVKGKTLHFSFNESPIMTRYAIRYHLTVKSLTGIESIGSGAIEAARLNADALRIIAGGSGRIAFASLSAQALSVKLTGSSHVKIGGGDVTAQEVIIQGAGDYEAGKLASSKARVVISGSGGAEVAARDRLSADISGAGKIKYHGSPKVEQSITGAGSIVRLSAS
jgi:Putative auto-transporter adhesin, head GIN domain